MWVRLPPRAQMKNCPNCNLDKPLSEFSKSKRTKDGHDYRCKLCQNASNKSWMARNWEKKIQQQGERRRALSEQLSSYKAERGCTCCTEDDPVCLELHHLDPTQKEINPADMAGSGWSWERMLTEIEKCVILCSNCHKKVHANKLVL